MNIHSEDHDNEHTDRHSEIYSHTRSRLCLYTDSQMQSTASSHKLPSLTHALCDLPSAVTRYLDILLNRIHPALLPSSSATCFSSKCCLCDSIISHTEDTSSQFQIPSLIYLYIISLLSLISWLVTLTSQRIHNSLLHSHHFSHLSVCDSLL